jgi:Raf kinase inhibitor-like YbhB/YbcL family protein
MRAWAATAVLLVLLAGCSSGPSPPSSPSSSASSSAPWDTRSPYEPQLRLFSSAFGNGQPIPRKHTCDGAGNSPPLTFLSPPAAAKSLALTAKDPDMPTPDAPERTLNHWVVWNATPSKPGSTVTFPEGNVSHGAQQGDNDVGHGWLALCPPPGSPPHHYNFTAYALDVRPALSGNATASDLDAAMEGHVLAQATLIGTYERALNTTTPAPN